MVTKKVQEFKVGDKVIPKRRCDVRNPDTHPVYVDFMKTYEGKVGTVTTVEDSFDDAVFMYGVTFEGGEDPWVYRAEWLNPAPCEEPKFVAGDRVVPLPPKKEWYAVKDFSYVSPMEKYTGEVRTVMYVENGKVPRYAVGPDDPWNYHAEWLRKATDEEIRLADTPKIGAYCVGDRVVPLPRKVVGNANESPMYVTAMDKYAGEVGTVVERTASGSYKVTFDVTFDDEHRFLYRPEWLKPATGSAFKKGDKVVPLHFDELPEGRGYCYVESMRKYMGQTGTVTYVTGDDISASSHRVYHVRFADGMEWKYYADWIRPLASAKKEVPEMVSKACFTVPIHVDVPSDREKLVPKRGAIAYDYFGHLGLILTDEPEDITYANGDSGKAWTGIFLEDASSETRLAHGADRSLFGKWSSKCPVVVGFASSVNFAAVPAPSAGRKTHIDDWKRRTDLAKVRADADKLVNYHKDGVANEDDYRLLVGYAKHGRIETDDAGHHYRESATSCEATIIHRLRELLGCSAVIAELLVSKYA